MARYTFGPDLASFTILPPSGQSNVVKSQPNTSGSVYAARTGGSALTDLLDSAGAATTGITSDSNGFVTRFQGPDGYTDLWADFGGGTRFHLRCVDSAFPKRGEHFINPKDYGAVGDNSTDDTTAFTNAIAAAVTAKVPVRIPGGHYKLSSTIDIPDGLILRGSGHEPANGTPTRLNFTSLNGTATAGITIVDGSDIVISDIYITGRSSGSGNEIQFTGQSRSVNVERVTINTSTSGAAIAIATAGGASHYLIQSKFSQVKTVGGANGFYTGTTCTSLHFDNCYAMSATNAGYLIQGTYIALTGCACDSGSLYGYLLQNAIGVSFNGCGAESNGRTGWHLTAAKHVVLNGCRSVSNNTSANATVPSFMGINDASDFVTAVGCIDTTPNAATSNSVRSWNGTAPTSVSLVNCDFTAKGVNANTPTLNWSVVTGTTAPSAGGAGALPATPLGYATINVNGVARKVAYY